MPYKTYQQHLWDERARVRKLWLNFNSYEPSEEGNFLQRWKILKKLSFETKKNVCLRFDSRDTSSLPNDTNNLNLFTTTFDSLQTTLYPFFGESIPSIPPFENSLYPITTRPENNVQDFHFGTERETENDNEGHRLLQRSLSMNFTTPIINSRRKSLTKSHGDLLNLH